MREYEDFDKTVRLQDKIDSLSPEGLRRKHTFLNSICRLDCKENLTFVALASLCDDNGFSNFSSQACMNATVEALYINGVQVNKVRMDRGAKFSLKPGKYDFRVDFHIEYVEEECVTGQHPSYAEDRTLEKKITVDGNTDYYLVLTYTLISHWERRRMPHFETGRIREGMFLTKWENHYGFDLATRSNLDKAYLYWADGLDNGNKFYYRPTLAPVQSASAANTVRPCAPASSGPTKNSQSPKSAASVSRTPSTQPVKEQGAKNVELLYTNGYYVGEVKNNKPHGKGTYKLYSGDRYEGEWVNGLKEGYGKYYFKNGDRYEGGFKNGNRHGKGTYYYSNGQVLVGEWKDGKRIESAPPPKAATPAVKPAPAPAPKKTEPYLKHNYTFANAKRTADDSALTLSDCKYVGRVKDGKPHLVGTYYYNDGSIYAGQVSNGIKEGYGIIIYKNGEYYQGEILDGRRNGFGLYHTQDGHIHAGLWSDDKMNFVCLEITKYKNGSVKMYKNGIMTDILYNVFSLKDVENELTPDIPVQYTFIEDDFYMGSFRGGAMDGFGRYMTSSGATYIGQMKDNDFCGIGAYRYKTGKLYIGQHKGSCFNGFGILIDEKNNITVGNYKDDELVEKLY